MSGVVWIDVEDLFQYARANSRPTGIQRIEYELCRSLVVLPETREKARFVRHMSTRNSFYTVPYAEIENLYSAMTVPDAAPPPLSAAGQNTRHSARDAAKRALYRLPESVRVPLNEIRIHQRESVGALVTFCRAVAAGATREGGRVVRRWRDAALRRRPPDQTGEDFDRVAQSGDVLVVLGSPWFHPDYAAVVRKAQARGIRFAMLLYDIVPLRRPEWCDKGLIEIFGAWTLSVLPLADVLLTISRASADDVVRYAAETGMRLRAAPQAIPIGTGFAKPPGGDGGPGRTLPPAGSYALIVSTIEARKNHILLFWVWRRLLDELPRAAVPTLVFAGRVGWLVADLMEQLRNASYLDGKIVLVRNPTDSELTALYRGCLFTLFPSFYEGWGLPVTESLGFGRPCIISNATSLPEAGGSLARYFDPDNSTEAYRVIRDTIADPDDLKKWQARVAGEFRPISWETSAQAILAALG